MNFQPKKIVHIDQISAASTENDKCMLLNHQIPNITYSGGGTNTYSALLKAKVKFLNQTFRPTLNVRLIFRKFSKLPREKPAKKF